MSSQPPDDLPRSSFATPIAEPPLDHARFLRNPSPEGLLPSNHPQHRPSRPRLKQPIRWPRRRSLHRVIAALALLLVLAITTIFTSALWMRHAMRASLPQNEGELDGSLAVAGLTAPVTVTRNPQGVPSIHAANLDDLLFAQGFITAQDRLWQMDILRRHAAGELAEILGPSLVEHDRRQRYLQVRAAADRAIAVLPPDQLHQLTAYARGVNAFIDSHRDDLPLEFHLLHYTPALWSPRDSILVSLAMTEDLSTEFPQKLNREELSAHLPADLVPDLYPIGSWRDRPPSQAAPDLTAPQPEIEQIPLDRSQSLNHPPVDPPDANPQTLLATFAALNSNICDGCRAGSNNWVVAGSRSASGAPLLSNDMHLSLSVPDIWYEASLHVNSSAIDTNSAAPLDVEGFTLPGIPFVIAGRNATVAWGFTNTGADVQDLRIEHLRGTGAQVQFERPDGTWAPVQHHTEHIVVRGGRDITLDVLTTTHALGAISIDTPIISPILEPVHAREHRALSLAWPIYDPSTLTIPLDSIDTAPDAASLVAAFAAFGNVSQNLVYADAHHIGYHMLGRIPIRGPAIQRPRTVQPFIMPDRIPDEDDEDESGSPQASLTPSDNLFSSPGTFRPAVFERRFHRHRPGRPFVVQPGAEPHRYMSQATGSHDRQQLSIPQQLPAQPTTSYTIGSPISPLPVDALNPDQVWSGYIPYDALPSIIDPPSGVIATANSRVAPDDYPYFLANNWADAYRVERIYHLLDARSTSLTPADMLRIQTDVHSEFDLLLAQRLAYALDHAQLKADTRRLHQAADILRKWHGDLTPDSSAAAIVSATHTQLWPMLLIPQIRAFDKLHDHRRHAPSPEALAALYTWGEKTSALEQLLQHTPARWLPPGSANWDDFLATAVERGLQTSSAPSNLATWHYGSLHPVDITHPLLGNHPLLSQLLGRPTSTGPHPIGGDSTTIDATGLHFGPSERFTADLATPNALANLPTGESANPASPWYLDQFLPWLHGTTFPFPLDNPAITHTLVLKPK